MPRDCLGVATGTVLTETTEGAQFTMANGFEETYTITGDLPPGDALKAQRALTAEGAEVVIKTVRPVAPEMFVSSAATACARTRISSAC